MKLAVSWDGTDLKPMLVDRRLSVGYSGEATDVPAPTSLDPISTHDLPLRQSDLNIRCTDGTNGQNKHNVKSSLHLEFEAEFDC